MFVKRILSKKTRQSSEGDYPSLPARAVALGYDASHDNAPRVLASGQGHVAERIITVARENGIALREDPVLVAALSTLDVGAEIPPELYAVVAEVLAYVYQVGKKTALDGKLND